MGSSFFYDPWSSADGRRRHHHHLGPRDIPFLYSVDPWRADYPTSIFRSYNSEPEHYPAPASDSRPRVVSVPVSYIGSDRGDKTSTAPSAEAARTAAAVAIQRVLRGYLVRKNMKVVSQVAVELDGIERSVRSQEQRLRADPKERLRVNERLMALLFRLDSVRGIRDYRKKVIRRVIVLQEFLDSISAESPESTNSSRTEASTVAEMRPENLDSYAVHQEAEEIPNNSVEESMARDCQDPIVTLPEDNEAQDRDPVSAAPDDGFETRDHINDLKIEEVKAADDGFVVVSMEEATDASPAAPNSDQSPAFESMGKENRETTAVPSEESSQANSTAGASGMEELLKKVMAESERLQGLVAVLCQRSAQQCQLMVGLADRVEHLERAMQRMEKKDKKRRASCLAPPADKKCGPTQQ